MIDPAIQQAKQAARERMWDTLEAAGVVASGVHGKIPNFDGAEAAAERLAALPVWAEAEVIKAVPDKAQLPVRVRALEEGRLVYMAVPNMAHERPFYVLDPARLTIPFEEAATGKGAAAVAPHIGTDEMRPIDLVVCGSVAVNRQGVRLGKGAGYSDLEVALLHEAGLIGPNTTFATTVHQLQVVDAALPEAEHDFRVSLIITPAQTIVLEAAFRRPNLSWDDLDGAKIAAIPVLAKLASQRAQPGGRRGRRHGARTDHHSSLTWPPVEGDSVHGACE